MEDSTEALAKSQLEKLYRLGILQHNGEGGESVGSSRNEKNGLYQRHEAFFAALPPPSAAFPAISRRLRSFEEDSDSSQHSSGSRSGGFYAGSSDGSSISRYRQTHKPRRSTRLRSSTSSVGSSLELPSPPSAKRDRRSLRMCFRHWWHFIRHRRQKTRHRKTVEMFVKQKVYTKWAHFLQQQRYGHDKKYQLGLWKLSRAISRWVQWKQRCCLLRGLLDGGRNSFAGRLIQQRVLRRWATFVKRRTYIRTLLTERTNHFNSHHVRNVWYALRIHVFRARQDRRALSRCMSGFCEFLFIRERQRQLGIQLCEKANFKRKRELLQRWRTFAYKSVRDRRLTWRVQFDIRRRRYFLLWCEVSRTSCLVERLRVRSSCRLLCEHFAAWNSATKAIRHGNKVREKLEKHRRAIYFNAFKDHTKLSARCRHALLTITRRRLFIAVERLQVWAKEMQRRREVVHPIQQKWRMRLVQCAWSEGWLKMFRRRLAWKHSRFTLMVQYFRAWQLFNHRRQVYHHQEIRALELYSKFCCQRAFTHWKKYHKYRLDHALQLSRAQQHHHKHLFQRGVHFLWEAAYQNTQNSLRSHHLRQQSRISLKTRHFRAWQEVTQSGRKLADQLRHLQQSQNYQNSLFNPYRRMWSRWQMFVATRRQLRHCGSYFQMRRKRQVLFAWHQQAILESRLRAISFHKSRKVSVALFNHWKCRVEKWRKVSVICELAVKVYERKMCTRFIQGWHCRTKYRHRVCLVGQSVQRQREMKLQIVWFSKWHEKFVNSQRITCHRQSQVRRQLRSCFNSWYRHSAQKKVFSRKLTYFTQVFGKHPSPSPVARVWHRWQHSSSRSKYVKMLHRKHRLKQAQLCWSHWKLFHTVCQMLRFWRCAARAMANRTNKRGARIRCLRESRFCRLQKVLLDKWKLLIRRRRSFQEIQSLWKHQLNRELERAAVRLQQVDRLHLRHWFQRWNNGVRESIRVARDHFRTYLLQKAILGWWRTTIHSKQEKVLMEAQQAIGKLSYYHPQQQTDIAPGNRINNQKKENKYPTRKVKVVLKEVVGTRKESMRQMRRMLDPCESSRYSRLYQDGGKQLPEIEPKGRAKLMVPVDRAEIDLESCQRKLSKHRRDRDDILHDNCGKSNEGRKSRIVPAEITQGVPVSSKGVPRIQHTQALQTFVPFHPVNNNQLSLEPVHGVQAHTDLHQGDGRVLLGANDSKHENVLPLFDDETTNTGNFKPEILSHEIEKFAIPEHTNSLGSNIQRAEQNVESSFRTQQLPVAGHSHISEPESGDRRGFDASNLRGCEYEICTSRSAFPVMFEPSLSLAPCPGGNSVGRNGKLRFAKTRDSVHTKRTRVVNLRSHNESTPLVDILKLRDGPVNQYLESGSSSANENAHHCGDPVNVRSVIREVVDFYADIVLTKAGVSDNGIATVNVARMSICYRMARDLTLLQNDFYIDELQKVCEASFKEKYIELPRCVVDADRFEEQAKLEHFLEKLVDSHSAYRKYLSSSLRQMHSIPLSALDWLAQRHLQPHIMLCKRARTLSKKSKAMSWIWEPMPPDMDLALEKLLPAITKYMRVLGQFFLRQAVQSASPSEKAQDYRISSAAFIALMKQVRVFPQLFHRRELENAVKLSACSSPDTEELNFPEFIETLVRCSCKLRWGELDGDHHGGEPSNADTVVAIKFVMLIFAMEGQGSVLTKRSEDVGAILGFLGQQQKKKQAEKLFRFRKMLVDNKRRARKARSHQPPSVWNQVRLQFSPKHSPTKSHDTFDELTESWDGGSPHRVLSEPFVFDALTNQPFDLEVPPTPIAESDDQETGLHSQTELMREERVDSDIASNRVEETNLKPLVSTEEGYAVLDDDIVEARYHASALTLNTKPLQTRDVDRLDSKHTAAEINLPDLNDSSADEQIGSFVGADEGSASSKQQLQAPTPSTGLTEPMEKDEFLREILSSIGDVEVLLGQSQTSVRSLSRQSHRNVQRMHASGSVESEAQATRSLIAIATGSDFYTFSDENEVDCAIPIRDPMLNYLTDIDRFTESTDQTSLLSIADMTGIPFGQDGGV